MASMNTKVAQTPIYTHEGAKASHISLQAELERTLNACFLWEDTFYENGESVAKRLHDLTSQLPAKVVSDLAIKARNEHNLRHAPLWLVIGMIKANYSDKKDRALISYTIQQVVNRPDELGELVSLYRMGGKSPLTKQMKLGLGAAFKKFGEYALAKYAGDSKSYSPRDVMFLVHPKPDNEAQQALWNKVANKTLTTPDTWETQLSAGKDKKETFTRLIEESKLGVLAFIRNLRNMHESGVSRSLVQSYSQTVNLEKALPFRFITAARHAPAWSDIVEAMMLRSTKEMAKLKGKTLILIDNSASMYGVKVSAKSELDRASAAQALAILAREICEESVIVSYSTSNVVVPAHVRGFSLADAVSKATSHGGTDTGSAVAYANSLGYDRIIIFTDEQSRTTLPNPLTNKAYIVNVATYQNGIGYGAWTHINGFSEATIKYIQAVEN